MIVEKECLFCNSADLFYEFDSHNPKTADGARCGTATCNDCGQVMFWYHKTKEKFKINGNKIEMESRPVLTIVPSWDGPMRQFIWDRISHSSIKTGRSIDTFYTNYLPSDTIRYWATEILP